MCRDMSLFVLFYLNNGCHGNRLFSQNAQWCQLGITRILDVEGPGMHNLQKPIVGTLVQGWTQNPCLAAGLRGMYFNGNEGRKENCFNFSHKCVKKTNKPAMCWDPGRWSCSLVCLPGWDGAVSRRPRQPSQDVGQRSSHTCNPWKSSPLYQTVAQYWKNNTSN